MNSKKIAIFASGSGSNAQNIIEYFADNKVIKIDSLWSNNPDAFALKYLLLIANSYMKHLRSNKYYFKEK